MSIQIVKKHGRPGNVDDDDDVKMCGKHLQMICYIIRDAILRKIARRAMLAGD